MKKAYISPVIQEMPMNLRSAVADLTGYADGDQIGSGGKDYGDHDPDANSRNSWDGFWEERE